jgi:hypothetical protein
MRYSFSAVKILSTSISNQGDAPSPGHFGSQSSISVVGISSRIFFASFLQWPTGQLESGKAGEDRTYSVID